MLNAQLHSFTAEINVLTDWNKNAFGFFLAIIVIYISHHSASLFHSKWLLVVPKKPWQHLNVQNSSPLTNEHCNLFCRICGTIPDWLTTDHSSDKSICSSVYNIFVFTLASEKDTERAPAERLLRCSEQLSKVAARCRQQREGVCGQSQSQLQTVCK